LQKVTHQNEFFFNKFHFPGDWESGGTGIGGLAALLFFGINCFSSKKEVVICALE
jgi:hypothetical protein